MCDKDECPLSHLDINSERYKEKLEDGINNAIARIVRAGNCARQILNQDPDISSQQE